MKHELTDICRLEHQPHERVVGNGFKGELELIEQKKNTLRDRNAKMEQEKNSYGLAEKGNGRTCATACREKGESAWLLMTEPGKSHASKIAIMKPHHPLSLLSRGILSQLFYLTPSPFLLSSFHLCILISRYPKRPQRSLLTSRSDVLPLNPTAHNQHR